MDDLTSFSPDVLAECVGRARNGDQAAWVQIESCVRTEVVPRLRLPPQVDSEEVVTDTLATLWTSLRRLKNSQRFLSFAGTVARRVVARRRRDLRRFSPLLSEPVASSGGEGSANLEREELLTRLHDSLRSADLKLFRLLYIAGASADDLARALGVDRCVLRKRKHRLHKRLRGAAEPYYQDP
jgi:RNA polymerase sigma factor (sigma-70 family)